ncbi:sporulation peptidase YabG [Microaerobacter geothermalis]|uniref:sporulation peptidase YabG n=1 Tax=Microaerobacter geothermalis TaxID=674972 RepID=UPI001F2BF7D7|nr:sporulation peptidase YabG [Microaerobacter geothermalis]MCF6095154.1 sporulation peptidase YabG [Microaerobacter geothermalis]
MIHIGDIVARKSYGHDILFKVVEINKAKGIAVIKGIEYRLYADAPLDDLIKMESEEIAKKKMAIQNWEEESKRLITQERRLMREKLEWFQRETNPASPSFIELPGKVLHLDGDPGYLKKCLQSYKEMNIPAYGVSVSEQEMPMRVLKYLQQEKPDILVITGHDGFIKGKNRNDINSYYNSRFYVDAVKQARQWERSFDQLIIFAGACQSYFEAIIDAGANYASSPERVNIHALDPVYVIQKPAFTPIAQSVQAMDVIKNSLTGLDGIGGIETRGVYRIGIPNWGKSETE